MPLLPALLRAPGLSAAAAATRAACCQACAGCSSAAPAAAPASAGGAQAAACTRPRAPASQHSCQHPSTSGRRAFCSADGKLDAGADDVAELFEETLAATQGRRLRRDEQDPLRRAAVLTTRREALSLYREVLRYSKLFVWRDERGRMWGDKIRESARREFEAARGEADPEIVNRLIITGRDAVAKTVDSFMAKRRKIQAEEDAAGLPPGAQPPGGLGGGGRAGGGGAVGGGGIL